MRLFVFTVLDSAVGAHLQPFFSRSKGEAIRSFTDACNDEKSQFNKHLADFTLVFLGEFDDVSGTFGTRAPERVISALEVVSDPFTPETRVESNGSGRASV